MCRRGDILTSETESETGSAGETIMFYTGLVIRQAFTENREDRGIILTFQLKFVSSMFLEQK